ncbi:hypothetical protein KIPB_014176, partial [Kipferlia bialata]|eukprot:g14176.t1
MALRVELATEEDVPFFKALGGDALISLYTFTDSRLPPSMVRSRI